jgi:hypothetical protein
MGLKFQPGEVVSTDKGLLIKPQSASRFSELLDSLEDLAIAAMAKGLKEARLFNPQIRRWISVPVCMIADTKSDQPVIPKVVFGEGLGFDAQSLNILSRMQESEKPMSLVDLETDVQEWVNHPLTEMLQMTYQQAIEIDLKALWDEGALDRVKEILRLQSRFEYNYEANLPYCRAHFSSTFEVVEFGLKIPKRLKRLVTIHNYEALTIPSWV